jgi:hypothetical protein
MSECALCHEVICLHGIYGVYAGDKHCHLCKEVNPELYCLPLYEGAVDWNEKTYFSVCKSCYTRESDKEEKGKRHMAPKVAIGPRVEQKTKAFYDATFSSMNSGAEYVLEMIPALFRSILSNEVKGKFEKEELLMILDLFKDISLKPDFAGYHLPALAKAAIALDASDIKWDVDSVGFMEKLKSMSVGQIAMLELWTFQFFAQLQEEEPSKRTLETWVNQLL